MNYGMEVTFLRSCCPGGKLQFPKIHVAGLRHHQETEESDGRDNVITDPIEKYVYHDTPGRCMTMRGYNLVSLQQCATGPMKLFTM